MCWVGLFCIVNVFKSNLFIAVCIVTDFYLKHTNIDLIQMFCFASQEPSKR